jgi:hypothetical protein
VPIGGEGRRIRIYNGAVAQAESPEQRGPELVVGAFQAVQARGAEAPEEGAQGVAMGEVRQAEQGRDEAIVDQRLGILDAPDPRDDREDVGQEEVGGVVRPVVVRGPAHVMLQEIAEPQRFAKLLKKTQTPEAGKAASLEEEMEFSWPSGHLPQIYQIGRFVEEPLSPRYSQCS